MKSQLTTFFVILSITTFAQVQFDVKNQFVEILPGNDHSDQYTVFYNFVGSSPTTYHSSLYSRGYHLKNNKVNVQTQTYSLRNNGAGADFKASPVIGVWGAGTELYFNGSFLCNGGETKPSIVLKDGGRFVFGKNAIVDIILDVYFTRQLWIYGDGTGVFELEEGFIADRTMLGTSPVGCGSLRFANTKFISHSSESIPLGYRPNAGGSCITGPADINSHLVFEVIPGSIWDVQTNDQTFLGGLWCDVSMNLNTTKKLTLTGKKTHTCEAIGGNYDNWGGLMMKPDVKLTKTGANELILNCDQGYQPGCVIDIKEGTVTFLKDALTTYPYPIQYKGYTYNQGNLNLWVGSNTTANILCDTFRIYSFEMKNQSTLNVNLNTKIMTKNATLNGTINIKVPTNLSVNVGDEFRIFSFEASSGAFSNVTINSTGINWDLTKLNTSGILKVQNLTNLYQHNISEEVNIYPNPTYDFFTVTGILSGELIMYNSVGQKILTKKISSSTDKIDTSNLPSGLYFVSINQKEFSKKIKLIVK